MPESVSFLVTRKAAPAKIQRILERIAPGASDGRCEFVLPTPAQRKSGAQLAIPGVLSGLAMAAKGLGDRLRKRSGVLQANPAHS